MKGTHFFRKTACLCFALLMLLLQVVPAAAASATTIDFSKEASLTITEITSDTSQPVPGLELTIYRIADFASDNGSKYALTNLFASCGISPDDLSTAEKQEAASKTVAAYIDDNGIAGTAEKTDGSGTVSYNSLPLGLYLVRVTSTQGTGVTAESETFFVSLPMYENSAWNYDVTAKPKCIVNTNITSHKVVKIWDDGGNAANARPASVIVGLYRDGTLQSTAMLNAADSWGYTWTGLSNQYTWTAKETAVPDGYTAAVENSGMETVITNTYSGGVSIPNNNVPLANFPQTGQDVIRIWVCLAVGAALVGIGCCEIAIDRRKKRHD